MNRRRHRLANPSAHNNEGVIYLPDVQTYSNGLFLLGVYDDQTSMAIWIAWN